MPETISRKQYLPRKSKEIRIATIWVMPVCVTDVLKYKGEAGSNGFPSTTNVVEDKTMFTSGN